MARPDFLRQTKCSKCRKLFLYNYEMKQIHPDLWEVGLQCPHCRAWYHSHFLNAELRRMQESMRGKKVNRKQRRHYQALFVKFNRRVRKERGVQVETRPIVEG